MSIPIEDQRLVYSIKSAAYLADCSESHISRAINEGYLPSVVPKNSKLRRIRHEDLVAWLNGD